MNARKTLFNVVILLSGILSLVAVRGANAQDVGNKLTYFTFSKAVALPGNITLPPGKYQFRLADPNTGRRVVQVLDDKGKVYALLLSMPVSKPEPSEKAQIRFLEVPAGQPPAVRTWWYTAETYGYEFVYPKQQALQIAKATGVPVLMTESPMGTPRELDAAEVTITTTVQDNATVAPAPAPVLETVVASNEPVLPKTAGPLALIGLIGVLSLAGAGGLRLFR